MARKKETIEAKVLEKESKETVINAKKTYPVASFIMALIGLILLFLPEETNKIIGLVIGAVFLIAGIISIITYYKDSIKISRLNLISGILYGILGLIIVLNPLLIMKLATLFLGIYLIVNGVLKIYNSYMMHNITNSYWKGLLISGTIITIFGLILIINPFSGLIITKVAGAFLFMVSIFDIVNNKTYKK